MKLRNFLMSSLAMSRPRWGRLFLNLSECARHPHLAHTVGGPWSTASRMISLGGSALSLHAPPANDIATGCEGPFHRRGFVPARKSSRPNRLAAGNGCAMADTARTNGSVSPNCFLRRSLRG